MGARSERIDQLRGVAALAVVACHLGVSAYRDVPNLGGSPWAWLGFVLGFGYLGVPLFFVISGFCIHLPQARMLAAMDPAVSPPVWRRFSSAGSGGCILPTSRPSRSRWCWSSWSMGLCPCPGSPSPLRRCSSTRFTRPASTV
jgi:hypothetical protein